LDSPKKKEFELLVSIHQNEDISIQERMINKGYGWAYDGGTKEKSYAELRDKRIADGSWTYPNDIPELLD
jgi:endonuclease YncB( thermonuclease family)